MNLEIRKLLLDIQESCLAIQSYTSGKTHDEYSNNRATRSATEREFEIIGEALNRLRRISPETEGRITDAKRIISFRNHLIHGCDTVDDLIVWTVIEDDLPTLLLEIETLISQPNEGL